MLAIKITDSGVHFVEQIGRMIIVRTTNGEITQRIYGLSLNRTLPKVLIKYRLTVYWVEILISNIAPIQLF